MSSVNTSSAPWLRWPKLFATCLLIVGWLSTLVAAGCEREGDCPTFAFRSRPDIHAPILDMQNLQPELVTPGYIFIAPYHNKDPGPYIYDNSGNLVWSASGQSGPKVAHNPHVCRYKGEDHICFFQGQQHQGFARGHGTIMDKHYRVVAQVESAGAVTCSDMHEFRLTPHSNGRTALMSVYQTRAFDLTANPHFLIKNGMGYVVDGVFQEIDIETGKLVFEWRSLDHLDPSLSFTYPGTTDTSGTGLKEWSPWDYFHLNSVDKNVDGDYLVSARHMRAIYKVSGEDGHVIWQLGGRNPTFEQANFQFGYQHHATWISENETHTVLSFFDNGYNGVTNINDRSSGLVVVIDHATRLATKLNTYDCPIDSGLSIGSQGSMQSLSNGNVHLGWGEWPWFSEHTANGTAVQFGKLRTAIVRDYMVYRSGKFNWTGVPIVKPSLWTYALRNEPRAQMVMYSSWNGATEVASWEYYVADSVDGPYELVGNARKTGFETTFKHRGLRVWAYAQALDGQGQVLGRSEIAKTFVPSEKLRRHCNELFCDNARSNRAAKDEVAALPGPDPNMFSSSRGFDTKRYYAPEVDGNGANYHEDKSDIEAVMGHEIDVASLMLGIGLTVITATVVIVANILARRTTKMSGLIGGVHRVWDTFRARWRPTARYMALDADGDSWDPSRHVRAKYLQ